MSTTTAATAQTAPTEYWTEHSASAGTPIMAAEIAAALTADPVARPQEQTTPAAQPERLPATLTTDKRTAPANAAARRKRH